MTKISALLFILFAFSNIPGRCKTTQSNQANKNDIEFSLEWQGHDRTYIVHLPPSAKMKTPLPVLIHLHGGGGTAKGTSTLTYSRFNTLSDKEGFIVVYPNAVEKNWNDGRKLLRAM